MTPEGSLLRAVTDLLTAERVWWCRQNTGSIVLGEGRSRRCFSSGRKGMADILALPERRWCHLCAPPPFTRCAACGSGAATGVVPLWIECKSQRGRQSPAQAEFQREVEEEGHAYLVVRDAREVAQWLKKARP